MLTAGVLRVVVAGGGVPSEGWVVEEVLSLLRERLDEVGETGAELGADMTAVRAEAVPRRRPLSFALRLRARNLCSVKALVSVSRRTAGPGGRGVRCGAVRCEGSEA